MRVISRPLMLPKATPITIPSKIKGTIKAGLLFWAAKIVATVRATTRAIIATEKSMPPVRMTTLCPMAIIPSRIVWRMMFAMFDMVRKCSACVAAYNPTIKIKP